MIDDLGGLSLGGHSYPVTPEVVDNISVTRPTANEINSVPPQVVSFGPVTADGKTVPIAYGKVSLTGQMITLPTEDNGFLYVAVGWCLGEIAQVKNTFINDEEPISGVEVRHYRGNIDQPIDPWLSSVLVDYTDTCVLQRGTEYVGLAYSVFKIPSGALSGTPTFKAIIKGRIVYDPTLTNNGDPFFEDNVIDVDFETGGVDQSNESQTITLHGTAAIDSSGLHLDAGNTSIIDEIGTFTWSLQGVAHLSTENKSAGTGSLRAYTTGDGLTSDVAVIPASSDFIFRAQINPTALSGTVGSADKDYIFSVGTGANELSFYIKGHKLAFSFNSSETVGTTTIVVGSFIEVELNRVGDLFTILLATVSEGSNTHASASVQSSRICLMSLDDGSFTNALNGYVDSVIII